MSYFRAMQFSTICTDLDNNYYGVVITVFSLSSYAEIVKTFAQIISLQAQIYL